MPRPLESDLQRQVVGILTGAGFLVEEIGKSRPDGSTGWQGNDPAAPDLNVHHPSWPRGVRVHLELKRDLKEARTLPRSSERRKVAQWAAYQAGSTWVVWSMETAVSAVGYSCDALAPGGSAAAEKLLGIARSTGLKVWTPDEMHDALV